MRPSSQRLALAVLFTALSARAQVPPRPALVRTADAFMAMDLEAFHAARARRPPPFDWGSNGCNFGEVTGPYRALFNRACDRHDFGYRNYGGRGLRLDPSESRRVRIDTRLHEDLRALCARQHPEVAPRTACFGAAASMYAAVMGGGSPWFHNVVPVPSNLPAVAPAAVIPRVQQGLQGISGRLPRWPIPRLR